MNSAVTTVPANRWKQKKTYLWTLGGIGILHGLLMIYGASHPVADLGIQIFVNFTLNVALLGWCYADAEERRIAISGLSGFLLLFIAWIGIPWYFLRSRGLLDALKGVFGLGLFGIWIAALLVGGIVGAMIEAIAVR